MNQALNYGKITWAYEDSEKTLTCNPTPVMGFAPVKIGRSLKILDVTNTTALALFKHTSPAPLSFREAYRTWFMGHAWNSELGEGRAFLNWLRHTKHSIAWKRSDIRLHPYFMDTLAPKHDAQDEMAQDLSFAINPVEVQGRKVKLYLQDEDVLSLLDRPYGEEIDFIELVKEYVAFRFSWEKWRAPAPSFLDWVKTQAKRPVFQVGQLGLCLNF